MSLLNIYNAATSNYLTKAKKQASGIAGLISPVNTDPTGIVVPANYITDDFQTEFKTRGAGDKVVVQATADDATNGRFTNRALNFYTEQASNPRFNTYRGRNVLYANARVQSTHYAEKNRTTRGIPFYYFP